MIDHAAARQAIFASIQFATGALNVPELARIELEPDTDLEFAALTFDSLAMMEFCMELEDKVGIEIDLGDLAAHPSVNRLASHIAARKAGG